MDDESSATSDTDDDSPEVAKPADPTSEESAWLEVDCCETPSLAAQYDKNGKAQTGWMCSSCFTEFTLDGDWCDTRTDNDGYESNDEGTTVTTDGDGTDSVGAAIDQF